MSREAEDLIRRLLVMDPTKRLGCGSVAYGSGAEVAGGTGTFTETKTEVTLRLACFLASFTHV